MGAPPAKNKNQIRIQNNINTNVTLEFDAHNAPYTAPVGEAIGMDLYYVNTHPFHIHVNPFQLAMDTEHRNSDSIFGGTYASNLTASGWFNSGDWHDTLLIPDERHGLHTSYGPLDTSKLWGKNYMRVLMQTDRFTGRSVVHCHILQHEDKGMMVVVNFTGEEGTRPTHSAWHLACFLLPYSLILTHSPTHTYSVRTY